MKILFVNEYCHPFVPGGAEESMMQLARAMIEQGHTVTIVTPNYGAVSHEVIYGVGIERYWFPAKASVERKTIRGWWHTSVFWWVVSAMQVARAVRRIRPDVIHVHGKFSIPAGLFAGKLFGIHTIFTARDYRALCNYGRCITEHKTSRRCTLREYWTWEFPQYVREYTLATPRAWVVNALYAFRGRFWCSFLLACVKRLDTVVCVSRAVARIYEANGVGQTQTIFNIQPALDVKNNDDRRYFLRADNGVSEAIFVGKLSPGKGAGLLPDVIRKTLAEHPTLIWTIYTNGGVLERRVREALVVPLATGRVRITPYMPHEELVKRIAQAALVCIPSVWQEPLTRLALEALQSGTPLVITDRGGSRELVEDGVTGRLVPADASAIADAVLDVVTHVAGYRERVRNRQQEFTNTFCVQPITDHERLYECLVRRDPVRTLGVMLPPGGSLTVLDRHGQKSRFMAYLKRYVEAFDRVLVFTFADEVEPTLPENVKLVPPRIRSKRLYTFLMPFVHRRTIRACNVIRVMQMDGCIPAVLARWLYGVPFVATYGYKYQEFAALQGRTWFVPIMRWIERLGVRAAHRIIYTTSELRTYFMQTFGSAVQEKLHYITNGVDVAQFAPAGERDRNTLLFVGRLEPQKNLFALLEAVALLPERQDLHLIWIGRGSLKGALEERARELGVQLESIDRVDHAALPQYYQRAGIFTLVSKLEGMPKALIEAMSAGCACLVSDCDGNRVIVRDGETGLIVGTDPQSIATGLGRLLRDPVLCEKLGDAVREEALARYDLRTLLKEECELLRSV